MLQSKAETTEKIAAAETKPVPGAVEVSRSAESVPTSEFTSEVPSVSAAKPEVGKVPETQTAAEIALMPEEHHYTAVVHEPEHVEAAYKSTETEFKSASGGKSGATVLVQSAHETGESHKTTKEPEPGAGLGALKGVFVLLAIIVLAALSLLYAQNHNLLANVMYANVLAIHNAKTTLTTVPANASNAIVQTGNITANSIVVHANNVSYYGNNTIKISGNVSPVPTASGYAVVVSVTNPNGLLVEGVELPLSASGRFETSFIGGGTGSWINGTYTITSICCGQNTNSTFKWTTAKPQPVIGPIILTLCSVYAKARNGMFMLCILLMVFGATMYSLAQVMPASHKKSTESYGLSMIVGSIIGMTLALLAPYILKAIVGNSLPVASCASGLLAVLV